jgi:hypothetical protein
MTKMRVYELAEELGVDSHELMLRLRVLGEFVRSASSTIEDGAVQRLRAGAGQQRPHPAGGTPCPVRPVVTPRPVRRTPAPQPRQGQSNSPRARRPEPDRYALDWARRWFEPAERQAWLNAGIGDDNAALAEQCAAANLTR